MLSFTDVVSLVQRVERDSPQVLLFKITDMCPSGRPSGKVQPSTVKPMLRRMGIRGSSRLQRVGGSESMCPRGEEGGVMVVGSAGSAISRDGERFRPGENEGREEGSYRSSELTGEKICG